MNGQQWAASQNLERDLLKHIPLDLKIGNPETKFPVNEDPSSFFLAVVRKRLSHVIESAWFRDGKVNTGHLFRQSKQRSIITSAS